LWNGASHAAGGGEEVAKGLRVDVREVRQLGAEMSSVAGAVHYGHALALGLLARSAEPLQINFLDSKLIEREQGAFAKVKLWMAAAALLVVGVIAYMVVTGYQDYSALEKLKKELAARKAESDAVGKFNSVFADLPEYYEKRTNVLECMKELKRILPADTGFAASGRDFGGGGGRDTGGGNDIGVAGDIDVNAKDTTAANGGGGNDAAARGGLADATKPATTTDPAAKAAVTDASGRGTGGTDTTRGSDTNGRSGDSSGRDSSGRRDFSGGGGNRDVSGGNKDFSGRRNRDFSGGGGGNRDFSSGGSGRDSGGGGGFRGGGGGVAAAGSSTTCG